MLFLYLALKLYNCFYLLHENACLREDNPLGKIWPS